MIYEGNSISKLQIQVATYVFELSAGNYHRLIVLLSSGDSFPHLIKKRRSQLGFVTYLLNYPRKTYLNSAHFTRLCGLTNMEIICYTLLLHSRLTNSYR